MSYQAGKDTGAPDGRQRTVRPRDQAVHVTSTFPSLCIELNGTCYQVPCPRR